MSECHLQAQQHHELCSKINKSIKTILNKMKIKVTKDADQADESVSNTNGDETASTKSLSSDSLLRRRKLIYLLSLNIQNFHRAIISSRRSSQQRMRRRHMMLRSYYIQQLLEIQTTYLQMLPVLIKVYKSGDKPDEQSDEVNESKPLRFYEDVVSDFSPEQWLSTFRMSQKTFQWLCATLHDALKPNSTSVPLKNLIPLEKRVALGLYAFATGADYRAIAALFEISRASVCKYIKRFAETIIEVLGSHLLAMPTTIDEYDAIRESFHAASNMPPLVVAVLGLCELPVSPILERDTIAYFKESGNATLILQALVDDKLLFRKVFMAAKNPSYLVEKDVMGLPLQRVNGRDLPCFVVAPARCYPLNTWLLRQYECPSVPHEHDFNDAMEQLLEFKDHALRRLFGRWHILHRKCDLEPKTMEIIALACCALHNLQEENEDPYMQEWDANIDISKYTSGKFPRVTRDFKAAADMRNFLARTISSTEM